MGVCSHTFLNMEHSNTLVSLDSILKNAVRQLENALTLLHRGTVLAAHAIGPRYPNLDALKARHTAGFLFLTD